MKKLILILVAAGLAGCSSAPRDAQANAASGASGQASVKKRYPMHGKIISVNAVEKSARIAAGPIGDYMGAMTMNYQIKDDAALAKLTPGTTIDATLFVDGDDSWVGEITPVAAGATK